MYQSHLPAATIPRYLALIACEAMQWKFEGNFLQGYRATGQQGSRAAGQLTQRHKPGAQPRSWPTFAILFSGSRTRKLDGEVTKHERFSANRSSLFLFLSTLAFQLIVIIHLFLPACTASLGPRIFGSTQIADTRLACDRRMDRERENSHAMLSPPRGNRFRGPEAIWILPTLEDCSESGNPYWCSGNFSELLSLFSLLTIHS